jgi:hypothetical protein
LWSEAANDGWKATADGQSLVRRDAFGWTNAFAMTKNAPVDVSYEGSSLNLVTHLLEVVFVVGIVVGWFVTRPSRRRRRVARTRTTSEAA